MDRMQVLFRKKKRRDVRFFLTLSQLLRQLTHFLYHLQLALQGSHSRHNASSPAKIVIKAFAFQGLTQRMEQIFGERVYRKKQRRAAPMGRCLS